MIALLVLLSTHAALADAVPPEPTDCPRGSEGRTGHSGQWCEALQCDGCDGTCREIGLCVETYERACGGMRPDTAEPCFFTVNEAHGRCRTNADCDAGTCIVEPRCVERANLCGCHTAEAGGVGVFLGLALLGLRRRGRR